MGPERQMADAVRGSPALWTGASRIWHLRRFDTYCSAHDLTVFDNDTVGGWVIAQLGGSGRCCATGPVRS